VSGKHGHDYRGAPTKQMNIVPYPSVSPGQVYTRLSFFPLPWSDDLPISLLFVAIMMRSILNSF